ncbi:MAG: glycosyltransferase family 1 protein [Cyclobacteriaceae bacterium]
MDIISYIHPSRTFLPCSGVGRHINNIVGHLNKSDIVQLKLFYGAEWLEQDKKLPDNAPLRDIPFKAFDLPERLLERSWKAFNWPKIDSFLQDVDWVFAPMETHIPTRKIKTAITLHDIQAFEKDLPWSKDPVHLKFQRRWKLWIDRAIKEANIVFTVSEFSRRRLIELLDVPEHKVKISGNAVEKTFIDKVVTISPKKVDYPYIGVIGGLRPKKGGNELLLLAKKLQKTWPKLRLITWGENDPVLLKKANELSNIKCLGMVSDEEMIAWLKGAHCSLFLSWYEGFGLPVLEAMACGVPVISSNQASLPEVAGSGARMVSPNDLETIIEHIFDLKNNSTRTIQIEEGFKQVEKYSWKQAAENVLNSFLKYD